MKARRHGARRVLEEPSLSAGSPLEKWTRALGAERNEFLGPSSREVETPGSRSEGKRLGEGGSLTKYEDAGRISRI